MNYAWDWRKNTGNLARHGIAFEDAIKIFEGRILERIDDRFDYRETRIYAIGLAEGREIVVVYKDVSETERRIISAWKADRHEREAYWEGFS